MLHILTYIQNNDNYNIISKYNLDIIKLSGNSNDKIYKIIDLCYTLNNNDILCYIDNNSIILDNNQEILDKYYKLETNLIISKSSNYINIFDKYIKDKTFIRCDNYTINMNFFIGKVEKILDFLNKIIKYIKINNLENIDDTIINSISSKLYNSNNNIRIDYNNILFYNYSQIDKTIIKDKKILINNNDSSIISLVQTKINNYNLKKEMICIIIYFIILYINKFDKFTNIFIFISILVELFNYELIIKHNDIHIINKIISFNIHIIHTLILYILYYFIYNAAKTLNINYLLISNIIYLIIILCFFIFKRCIFTIMDNYILNIKYYRYIHIYDILKYLFNINKPLDSLPIQNNAISNDYSMIYTHKWIKGNIFIVFIILLINIYFLYNKISLN